MRALRAGLPGRGQRVQTLAAADRPRPEGIRAGRRHGGSSRPQAKATAHRNSSAAWSSPEVLWACTTCHACVDKCPVRNEHVALIVEMRRKLVEQGKLDGNLQETLMSLQRYGNSQAKSPRKRFEWAKDLPRRSRTPARSRSRPLVPGRLRGLHPSAMRVSRMMALVFQAAGLDFGVLGDSEQIGRQRRPPDGRRRTVRDARREEHEGDGQGPVQRIVTTDPHTYHALKTRIPPASGWTSRSCHYTGASRRAAPAAASCSLKHRLTACAVLPRSLLPGPVQRHLRPAAAHHATPWA